jgi:predicted negative regulator of RcsB-dependent stress response
LAILDAAGLTTETFVPILSVPGPDSACIERPVRVIGYPDLGGECLTITRGVISGFDEEGNLKTDAEISQGNSGGGAFDENGNFLGVPTFMIPNEAGKIGYIVHVSRIRQWLSQTLKTGLPPSEAELRQALSPENINFEGNLDESTRYPRILGKFAAIEMLLKEGAYERVFPQVEYILEKRPRSSLAYRYLGDAYLYLGEYDDAAEAYSRALELNPYDVSARGNYALALTQPKRPENALEQYEAVLRVADNSEQKALAYHNMGRIYHEMRDEERARKYYQKALGLKPDFALASEHLKELQSDG